MTLPPPKVRPLAALRALIDAVDRDIIQSFSRRMALVREVADFKRANAVGIRDLAREREVLKVRGDRASELGLPGSVIQSVFRLMLVASRDYQASLRAEVPLHQQPRTIAIIGGKGKMGQCFERAFADLGHAVMIADVDTKLSPEEATRAADVVVVSVPIESTVEVIETLGPKVQPGAVLMDLTSIKEGPLSAMMKSCTASVLGAHPMFGPGVHTFTGQRMILCRGRGDDWFDWARTNFRARGMVVTEATAAEHDKAMSVVQVLNHFHTQVLGLTLARMGMPVEETMKFTSPAYLLEAYVTARHFAQSPELYGSIEMRNPRTSEVTKAFSESASELAQILADQDTKRFEQVFSEVGEYFGEFTGEALEQSQFLVDRLVELTSGRSQGPGH